MDKLPNEVLAEILSYLTSDQEKPSSPDHAANPQSHVPNPRDITESRLVSRQWNQLVWPLMVIDPRFNLSRESMRRLESLSNHAIMSLMVQEIRLYPGVCIDGVQQFGRKTLDERIKGIITGAEGFHDDLGNILKAFRKLKSVELGLQSIAIREELSPCNMTTHFLQSLARRQLQVESNQSAILQRLTIGAWDVAMCGLDSPSLQALKPLLRNLSSLNLHCNYNDLFAEMMCSDSDLLRETTEREDLKLGGDSLYAFVQQAEAIQELSIGLDSLKFTTSDGTNVWPPGYEKHGSVSDVLRSLQWSQLTRLNLTSCMFTRTQIESFLVGHAATLRHLTIAACTIDSDLDEPWIAFFKFLKEHLRLTSFQVSGDLQAFDEDQPRIWSETDVRSVFTFRLEGEIVSITLDRVINYLVAGSKYDYLGAKDDVSEANFDWDSFDWDIVEDGYMSS